MDLGVFGLGNPGPRYVETLHNVGFGVVDRLSARLGVTLRKRIFHQYRYAKSRWRDSALCLVEPLTFMNASGRIMHDAMGVCGVRPEGILVVCDSLDLSPGNCRLRMRGSAGGHKGLESIIRRLGTQDFMRLLIGIGRPGMREKVVDYVLGRPGAEEAALIEAAVEKAADAVLRLAAEGPERVMNELNRREPST